MSSKIYTRTGDKGQTSLLGGSKVSKGDIRISAYGNIDELNSFLGFLHDHDEVSPAIKQQIHWIQNNLFTAGSILAAESDFSGFELPQLKKEDVLQLENWIDGYDSELPQLKNFILPAGHKTVSLCHVCRTVCRRAERGISAIEEDQNLKDTVIPFINRLSDYLFVLARKLAKDTGSTEVPWTPRTKE